MASGSVAETPFFDVRITATECLSYRNQPFTVALTSQEKDKKDNYLRICHEQWKVFMPLVYTGNGIAEREANASEKRIPLYIGVK